MKINTPIFKSGSDNCIRIFIYPWFIYHGLFIPRTECCFFQLYPRSVAISLRYILVNSLDHRQKLSVKSNMVQRHDIDDENNDKDNCTEVE